MIQKTISREGNISYSNNEEIEKTAMSLLKSAYEVNKNESSNQNTKCLSQFQAPQFRGKDEIEESSKSQLELIEQSDEIIEPDTIKEEKKSEEYVVKLNTQLSEVEIKKLQDLEAKVEGSYLSSCEAILEIDQYEDGRLWRASGGFKQFADYVKSKFGLTKKHCSLLIRSAKFIRKLKIRDEGGAIPVRESHIRPIIQKLKTEEEQVEFWDDFCKRNEVKPESVGKIKASAIRQCLDEPAIENQEIEADEDDEIKNKSKKSIKIINKLKKVAENLPNFEKISEKIAEIEELIEAN
jgi:hypothetical protein